VGGSDMVRVALGIEDQTLISPCVAAISQRIQRLRLGLSVRAKMETIGQKDVRSKGCPP